MLSVNKIGFELLLTLTTLLLVPPLLVTPTSSAEPRVVGQIEFSHPFSTEEAHKLAQDRNLKITQVEHTFSINEQEFTGFYSVSPDSNPEQIRSGLVKEYEAFIKDIASSKDQIKVDEISSKEYKEKLKNMLNQWPSQKTLNFNDIKITKITVEGSSDAIRKIKETSQLVKQTDIAPTTPVRVAPSAATTMAYVNWETWAPEGGNVLTGPSQYGGRFAQHYFYWDNKSGFGTNSTYEHDFFLNNYPTSGLGPGTYLSRGKYPNGIPIVNYAASSLPNAYLDTRFLDPASEIAYTIGSANAYAISTNTWYLNYIRTNNGDASRDNAKLVAQRGYRSPSGCYSTWCSYGSQNFAIFSAWTLNVPSGISWQR